MPDLWLGVTFARRIRRRDMAGFGDQVIHGIRMYFKVAFPLFVVAALLLRGWRNFLEKCFRCAMPYRELNKKQGAISSSLLLDRKFLLFLIYHDGKDTSMSTGSCPH